MDMLKNFGIFQPWTWFASLGFFAFLTPFIPAEYFDGLLRKCRLWIQSFVPYVYCDIHEFDNATVNSLYPDVQVYLSSLTAQASERVNLSRPTNAKELTFYMAHGQRTYDVFDGANLEWVHHVWERNQQMYSYQSESDEKRSYQLTIHRKDKKRVLEKYMTHIQMKAKELKRAARELLLYTNTKGKNDYFSRGRPWESVSFIHPATFDTLALDGDLKTKIVDDLEKFAMNEDYYNRVGKAWKRGYLLYGPPGTGKSSMIAAIANKMRYDVYDLELTEVDTNVALRKLLLHTSNKSVIVIEDIDCSLDLSGQRKKKKKVTESTPGPPGSPGPPGQPAKSEESKVTLSGLLNFVDGLWSCCGTERIFIFTTNYVEKLDPALLRAGRMDMHIQLSYCTFSAFKVLAKNYLQLTEHELFVKVEAAFEGAYMTPAEVGEMLIQNQDDPELALESIILSLHHHRVKPCPPPPESDDDTEDGKEAEKKAEIAADSSEVKEEVLDCSSKKAEKLFSTVGKVHPIDEPEIVEVTHQSLSVKEADAASNGTKHVTIETLPAANGVSSSNA